MGVVDLGSPTAIFIQGVDVRRERVLPLLGGRQENLEYVDDGAPLVLLVPVSPPNGVGPAPADLVLDVDQHGDGQQCAGADEEEEAIEEEGHLDLLPLVLLVELVGSEAGNARLQPAGAQCDGVQCEVEDSHLQPVGPLAHAGHAWRRPKGRDLRRHR
ncbi:unnamed protein product [Spirodela intermedia]|uniref:Uncharacterized protein n=2 Tax=Spirodela intermedia TaxID=51605 RepID=A0A7I8LFQ9_SPIIN|nr:unnamed protein product [Spirodela intermedia]CAA6671755.1 unnamed protein product [Spirodela intermedia]CAA7408873.1 unnamed protein product [Spirodela intermedia]